MNRVSKIIDRWFLYEPLLFDVYCTHKLEENDKMKCPFRSGKGRLEYNPKLVEYMKDEDIEKGLKLEIIRILLKHPYQRVPENPNRSALTTASNITIKEHCDINIPLPDAFFYNFAEKLSFEEYYKKLSYICPENAEGTNYDFAADASELWAEDEEMADKVNAQIEKAQQTNQWGSITGDLQEEINASLIVPMDYRRILSQFRANIISQRRKLTRMKPNRRYGFDYMGSQFEPKTHLLVAVDVSGSISNEDLKNFFSIINRFFSYGVEKIEVITFDVEITDSFELKKAMKNIKNYWSRWHKFSAGNFVLRSPA